MSESDPYLVAVKHSARRSSQAAGEWVAKRDRYREFDSKARAREWADAISPSGRTLWVQDAHPRDTGPADGYLLARRTTSHNGTPTDEPPGEQTELIEPT